MDSIAIAFWKKPEFAVTVNYGQRPAAAEIRAAREVSNRLDIKHLVIEADLSSLGSGDLAGRPAIDGAPEREWWPYRNQMLVTLTAMRVIEFGVKSLLVGCLRTDSFHADGRKDFIEALSGLLKLQEGKMELLAPAIDLSAVELINKSEIPFDLLAWAHSCHTADEACGFCRGCLKHYSTLQALGHEPY